MKQKHFFAIAIAVLISTPAWSSMSMLDSSRTTNTFTPPTDSDSSPYQVLVDAFNQATAPAQLSDFDAFDKTDSTQKCRYAVGNSILQNQYAVAYSHVIPGSGPLFPGTTIQKIVIWGSPSWDETRTNYRNLIETLFNNTTNTTTATGLMVHETGLSDGTADAEFRKNGANVVYKLVLTSDSAPITMYGYCWKE